MNNLQKYNLRKYLGDQENLPDFMKDFHDQKDLFKAIYDQWKGENKVLDQINWVDAQVFTIDIFLWWMGLHGYKLQKIRSKGVGFYDPVETINYFRNLRLGKESIVFNLPCINRTTHKNNLLNHT